MAATRWAYLRLNVEDHVPLAAIARDSAIPLRTLERWKQAYKAHGLPGLKPSERTRSGGPAPDVVRTIEGLALIRPRQSIATITRIVGGICSEKSWAPPSYTQVRRVIADLDPGMRVLALEGPVAYRDKYELILRRRADRPNAIWQADHTMLDILIRGADGRPTRPWLTIVLDDYSRAIAGYMVILGAPTAMNTALALRQAIWPKSDPAWPVCGIPDVLYVDHGSDFTSHHLTRVTNDLRIRMIHSAVARPQGRGKVERFFGTINTELLSALPGHISRGHPQPTPTLRLEELTAALHNLIVGTYNHRCHSETQTTPTQGWIADGWMPRLPETLEQLDELLLTVQAPRKVRRDGIRFQGLRYHSPTLASYVGETITIRYDPRDVSEIRVFHRDQFVCKAINPEYQHATIGIKEIQAARTARRRQLRTQINERIRSFPTPHSELGPDEPPPPTETPSPTAQSKLRVYEED
ncbi:Mu transposase C-terminal domain-containing protein [Arthrobacter sp. CP30]